VFGHSASFGFGQAGFSIGAGGIFSLGQGSKIAYESDFSAGADGIGLYQGDADGNIDGVEGVDDTLRLTVNNTESNKYAKKNGVLSIGKRHRISLDYYVPNGQTSVDGIQIRADLSFTDDKFSTTGAWTSVEVVQTATVSDIYVYALDGDSTTIFDVLGADVFYLKNIVITRLA